MSRLLEGKEPLWLPLLSGSMAPSLLPGDKLYIDPRVRTLQSGSIAVFYRKGTFFCHRILFSFKWGNKHYIFEKGDANDSARFILAGKMLGTVLKVRREGKETDLTTEEAVRGSRKLARRSSMRLLRIRRWT